MTHEQTMNRVRAYRTVGVWPSRNDLNVEGWMANFESKDQGLAVALLQNFTYYSDALAREVLRKAVRQCFAGLSPFVTEREALLKSAIFTCPPGEDGKPTASGYAYLRMLRELGLSSTQTFQPDAALLEKERDSTRPLVVLDDFSCTGAQFDHYWSKPFINIHGSTVHPRALVGPIVFSPLFTTWMAFRRLAQFSNVLFMPVHEVAGILSQPEIKVQRMRLRAISLSLGAVDSNGTSTEDWKGFGALSHAIAVGGTIPDSCLPIFYLERSNWTPLKRRRE